MPALCRRNVYGISASLWQGRLRAAGAGRCGGGAFVDGAGGGHRGDDVGAGWAE